MPLKHGMSKAAAFHDLKHGPHHKDRTRAQEIAIALKYARKPKGSLAKKRRHAHAHPE